MRRRRELERLLAEARAAADRPRYLRILAEALIHDRVAEAPGPACPCCGSVDAEVVERRPIDDLVIDTDTGERLRAASMTAREWADLCRVAELRDLPIRLSRAQVPLVLDETPRHIFASGSNRSSKTTAGLLFMAVQWLRRGKAQARYWLVAPTTEKAYRLLEKLFLGTDRSPPILPRELVVNGPASARSSDLQTLLVDGSVFDLRAFQGDPEAGRLKSDSIIAALVDEASHLPGSPSLVALDGRTVETGGRLFLASTPLPSSFLRTAVVEPAQAFARLPADDPRRASGEHPGAPWIYVELPMHANPWVPLAEIERKLRALNPDDPAVMRDFYGKWVANTGLLWRDFHVERAVLAHEARDVAELGRALLAELGAKDHINVTDRVVRLIFGRPSPHFRGMRATNTRYLLGMDVNCHPCTAIAIQVSAPKDRPDDRDAWHFYVFEETQVYHGSSFALGERLSSTVFGRTLEPGTRASPFAGAGIVSDATAVARDPTHHKYGKDPIGVASVLGPMGFDVRCPLYTPSEKGPRGRNPNRYDSHLIVQRLLREGRLHVTQRCEALIEAFLEQEDSGDGVEPMTISATRSDRLASPMDALRYPLWAALKAPAPVKLGGAFAA